LNPTVTIETVGGMALPAIDPGRDASKERPTT
jgi:hypothetical protein